MTRVSDKRIAILLPTYNGAAHLREQIDSIFDTSGADVHIFAHDDGSKDETLTILRSYGPRITVLDGPSTGGAAQNIFFLICNAPWDEFEYVALADQDDIWRAEKLERALQVIEAKNLDVYSSDVMAFWEDGRQKYIKKSYSQCQFDYLFEAGGPGNTHVYTQHTAKALRDFLNGLSTEDRTQVALHDWLFYAFCRAHGLKWFIDTYDGVLYRQHDSNVIGAASGFRAILKRIQLGYGGWYLGQVKKIAALSGSKNHFLERGNQSRLSAILSVLKHHKELRRKSSEARMLALILITHHLRH